MSQNEIEIIEALNNWYAILDYEDKETTAWIRRNITKLKKELRAERKRKQLS